MTLINIKRISFCDNIAPVMYTYRWAKGHQNSEKELADLLAEVQIICEVDAKGDMEIPVFLQEVYGVYIPEGKISRKLKRGVRTQCRQG